MISEFLSVSVFSYIVPNSNKTNLLSCSNGAFFEMMLIRGLVLFSLKINMQLFLRDISTTQPI